MAETAQLSWVHPEECQIEDVSTPKQRNCFDSFVGFLIHVSFQTNNSEIIIYIRVPLYKELKDNIVTDFNLNL